MINTDNNIKLSKGNIPINYDVYQKYRDAKEIFDNVPKTYNYDSVVNIREDIEELKDIDFHNLYIGDAKRLAKKIFGRYYNCDVSYNNDNKIYVSNSSISEAVVKLYQSYDQREMIKEHLLVISNLENIIKQAILVNQTHEIKGRDKYNTWNYYFCGIKIGDTKYDLEFDIVSMANGKNKYYMQRLQKSRYNH